MALCSTHKALVATPVGLSALLNCRKVDVIDGHLVVLSGNEPAAIYAPGHWNSVRLEPIERQTEVSDGRS